MRYCGRTGWPQCNWICQDPAAGPKFQIIASPARPLPPVPRPPQPTRPILIVLLPAAWTKGTVKPVETAVAVAAPNAAVEPFMKSRRDADAGAGLVGSLGLFG